MPLADLPKELSIHLLKAVLVTLFINVALCCALITIFIFQIWWRVLSRYAKANCGLIRGLIQCHDWVQQHLALT